MVERVAHEVHERVADLLDHGLVEFGLGAADDEFDLLAEFPETSRTTRLKRLKVSPICTMRSCSAESRMFSTGGKDRGGFDEVALPALDRQQVGRGAGDDEFADEVDQLVELVGMDAHELASRAFFSTRSASALATAASTIFLVVPTLFSTRISPSGAGHSSGIAAAACASRPSSISACVNCRNAPAFRRGASCLRQFGDQAQVVGDVAVRRQDAQLAVVAHEVEDALDVGLRRLGLQADLKAEVARPGSISSRRRHGVGDRLDADDLAQTGEVADEGERVGAAAQDVLSKRTEMCQLSVLTTPPPVFRPSTSSS